MPKKVGTTKILVFLKGERVMGEYLYENFKLYFPSIEKGCISWEQTDLFELEIHNKDGSIDIYNDMNHSLGPKIDTSTDSGWRKEFARRLRKKMAMRGLTQNCLCEITGISQQLLSLYTKGKTLPSVQKASALAKALNCSVNDLIGF